MRRFTLIVLINLSLLFPALALSWSMKPQASALAKSASRVFMERCFRCHGANGQTLADGVFVNSRTLLVKSRKLIPGDVNSAILKAVESGAMPPPQKPGDRLPAGELTTLREWVAKGAPDWQEKESAPLKRKFLAESDLVTAIAQDLESAPERDRKYLRYYSIAHLYNADIPEEELQGYRVGLSKLLNSLSWARKIHVPVAIDSAKVLLRIDLRDYDWSAEVWGSIVSYYPYGYKTAKSEAITRLSGAVAPYVRADWFVERASLPPLYHIILKLPDTIEGLENLLKVEVARRIDEEKQVTRAGLRKSGVSQNNRVVERHETDYGAYWKSYDFSASDGEQNIFINPLDLKPAGGEMIFNLPNGMQAYFIVGKGGKRLDAAPAEIVSDRNHPDEPIVRTGRSCMSCHYGGIKDAKDGIRAVVEKSQSTPYDRNKVLAIYRPQASVDSFIKEDSERFQEAVRLAGGLPAASPTVEPINALSRKFKGEVSVLQAAAEAGLSVSELQKRIGKSQRLQQLGYGQLLVEDGGMKRDAWESYFGDLAREASLGEPLMPLHSVLSFIGDVSSGTPATPDIQKLAEYYAPKLGTRVRQCFSPYVRFIANYNHHISVSTAALITANLLFFADRYDVDPRLVVAMILVESGFDPMSTTKTGGRGLGHINPKTAKAFGIKNPYDPVQNLDGSIHYLRDKIDMFRKKNAPGNGISIEQIRLAMAAYNPESGQTYVRRVESLYRQLSGQ